MIAILQTRHRDASLPSGLITALGVAIILYVITLYHASDFGRVIIEAAAIVGADTNALISAGFSLASIDYVGAEWHYEWVREVNRLSAHEVGIGVVILYLVSELTALLFATSPPPANKRFSGFLWVVMLVIIITLLMRVQSLHQFADLADDRGFSFSQALFEFTQVDGDWRTNLLFTQALADIVMLLLYAASLILFWSASAKFKLTYGLTVALNLVYAALWTYAYTADNTFADAHTPILLNAVVLALIMLPYLAFSERVKQTFK